MIHRRGFLGVLSALPFMGRFFRAPQIERVLEVTTTSGTVITVSGEGLKTTRALKLFGGSSGPETYDLSDPRVARPTYRIR